MSDILKRFQQSKQDLESEQRNQYSEQRDFTAAQIQRIGKEAVDKMVETDFKTMTDESPIEIKYRDDTHMAWVLASWPASELPRLIVESYDVILVDTGEVMSRTKYWEHKGGGIDLQPYDPSRFELNTMNATTIYSAIAKLPGDTNFKEENLNKIPR